MAPAIFFLRLGMAIVALVNLGIVIAFYAWVTTWTKKPISESGFYPINPYEITWEDYAIIISSVVLLPAYLYSIWGKKSLVSNKYARAVLMLLPALFLIGVQLRQVDLRMQLADYMDQRIPENSAMTQPFSCWRREGGIDAGCGVWQSYTFIPVVFGFFVIIEVAVTLFRGPLHSTKEAYL
ncbi:hypothetical protein BGZ97_006043 [Linnemannia gamsii]|jgi:hypothetical protein|uniref:Uncharacterized protein n=1 Tax=Linnemannia gamsii TaxID=64522 RepID=A0A9P6QTQ9_9FUNG|nr:hypothetical protein BGZ97_006043 [Linnemannia gamsii]